jgi:hypothetical protein
MRSFEGMKKWFQMMTKSRFVMHSDQNVISMSIIFSLEVIIARHFFSYGSLSCFHPVGFRPFYSEVLGPHRGRVSCEVHYSAAPTSVPAEHHGGRDGLSASKFG